jgi:hypothetical protein
MNPLDWTGPNFLALYVALIVAIALIGFLLRSIGPHDPMPDAEAEKLDPYEIAFLAGGWPAAIHAAVTSLVHRGRILAGPAQSLSLGPSEPAKVLVGDGVYRGYVAPAPDHAIESPSWPRSRQADGRCPTCSRRSTATLHSRRGSRTPASITAARRAWSFGSG